MNNLTTPPRPSAAPQATRGFNTSRRRSRRTIALLADYMTLLAGAYEGEIRAEIDSLCNALDVDLWLVYGLGIEHQLPNAHAHNAVYDLLGPDSVDGIVALTSTLATHCGPQRAAEYLHRYADFPLCSLGVDLPEVPSVVVDHRSGMATLLEHLLQEHGRRRLAFIGGTPGHPDAEARLQAYREALAKYDIAYDGGLVAHADFLRDGGIAAVQDLLSRGVKFDAVVAANDTMAEAALDVLRAHGIRVPHDVAVTGFDDILSARVGSPPMTTVAQPFAAMVKAAVEIVLAQLDGLAPPKEVALPSEFVVRQSCGCTARARRERMRPQRCQDGDASKRLSEHAKLSRTVLAQILETAGADGEIVAARLVDSLGRALEGDEEAFLGTLEEIRWQSGNELERTHALQKSITYLRELLRPTSSLELEDLLHDARDVIAASSTRVNFQHRLELDAAFVRMLSVGEQLSNALDLSALKAALERSLPATGIQTALVARHSSDGSGTLDPFVAIQAGKPVNVEDRRYPASQLIMKELCSPERRQTLVVYPMVCETQNLGIVAFDYTPAMSGYQMLRDQISSALRTVSLQREVIEKTKLHERSLQERAATAKRMQALSVLAGGVAHDLNNALGPLVGLPDVMIAELSKLDTTSEGTAELRADLECIRSGTQRAAQTIKDLLTLSRQGRTAKETLDLNRAVRECLGADWIRSLRESNPRITIACETANETLVIRGSDAHIGRAVTNLVRNAVEAIVGAGEVRVKTTAITVREPYDGFETIDPGDYAVVVVSDTGVGIPTQELGWIFEPFTSRKRVSDTSGTGLGLAIVHGVIKEHEGFVDVTSNLGAGTVISLFFPRLLGSARPAAAQVALTGGSARVLVVDDEPIQQRTARRLLSHLGYRVETLGSGREAIKLFGALDPNQRSPYDLLLLDMMLNEDVDGLQVFEQVRARFPEQRAIIVSGHAPTGRVEQAFAQGLGWLSKPYLPEALATAVREALGCAELYSEGPAKG